ncbi:MAG: type 3 dihydrofolate reductase [endosymbiont of Galathealinum brachiosum]|uniref:Dihydrofolate reductase n=1 Tax=endosymbiont of Galathealinum brachiosum TaxID=2200906 RepID=A0A370DBB5_9GAMM|nr:MAG: type 3 dihydrofolate reductase [endosymbiont of Galathealinum brachiosum]
MIISLIAALDKNRLIGADNGMPWHLPADFKHFKEITMGKPVIMGRKTFESIGRPLPGRQNIVISRNGFSADGITSVNSIDAALQLVSDIEEVMIIGGANIYQQMIEKSDRLYLTHVDAECEGDAWFPEFDVLEWNIINEFFIRKDERNNFDFNIVTYERKNK